MGLEHATAAEAATRAVLEGVAFAIRGCRKAFAAIGTELTNVLAVGGESRSDYWLNPIATCLDVRVRVPAAGDFGGAFGAARPSMMASGCVKREIATPPTLARPFHPIRELVAEFNEGHSKFRAAQSAIMGLT